MRTTMRNNSIFLALVLTVNGGCLQEDNEVDDEGLTPARKKASDVVMTDHGRVHPNVSHTHIRWSVPVIYSVFRAMLPQGPRWLPNTDKLKLNFHWGH